MPFLTVQPRRWTQTRSTASDKSTTILPYVRVTRTTVFENGNFRNIFRNHPGGGEISEKNYVTHPKRNVTDFRRYVALVEQRVDNVRETVENVPLNHVEHIVIYTHATKTRKHD